MTPKFLRRHAAWPIFASFALFTIGLTIQPPTTLAQPQPASLADKLGTLNWGTNEGRASDQGKGTALRVWENLDTGKGDIDLFITFEPQKNGETFTAVDIYFGWRNFPSPRMTKGNAFFDAEYLEALFNNQTSQAKRLRIEGAAANKGKFVDKFADNGPVDYYYVKVVGVRADGTFADLRDVSVGSAAYREDPRWELPPAPKEEECVALKRPTGDREAMTKWEPYGTKWAEGHEPPKPAAKTVPGNSPLEEKLGVLNWAANEGAYHDGGNGTAVRVWNTVGNRRGRQDLLIHVKPQEASGVAIKFLDVYLAWRNFPVPRLTSGNRYFDADYLKAMFNNETAQTKRMRIEFASLKDGWFVDRVRDNGPIEYYYVKLVGVAADEQFIDIRGYSVGSVEERQDPRWQLNAAPSAAQLNTLPVLKREPGHREKMTKWEPYGTEWAQGHQPPPPPRVMLPVNVDLAVRLGKLTWDTNEGRYQDDEKGTALRVWNNLGNGRGKKDLLIYVAPQDIEAAHIDVYIAWRNFPVPRFTPESRFFDADYVKAIFDNHTAQTKRVRIEAAGLSKGGWIVDAIATNGPIDYYYLKLVGVTADGRFFDIRGYSAGSAEERADTRWKLERPRDGELATAATFTRPKGDRELKTKWEPYGTKWAQGHEPPKVKRTYPAGNSDIVEKLGALNWNTNEGKCHDEGKGTALRNWELGDRGQVDIFVQWAPDQPYPMKLMYVFFAWRTFPVPRMTKGDPNFDPDYLRALWKDETMQTRYVKFDPVDAPKHAFNITGSAKAHDWYYLKLVGETADGMLFDVENWSLGSRQYREDPRWNLPPAPTDLRLAAVGRPKGDRNLKTKWEPYGNAWAPGHEPPKIKRSYPAGSASIAEKLGALNWNTNEGKCMDDGNGTALRNWELDARGHTDIIVMWGEQQHRVVNLYVFWGWRVFPVDRMTNGNRFFDKAYLEALWENKTIQAMHAKFEAARFADHAFVDVGTAGRPHDWYYMKLVGETSDGQLVDIENWSIGSKSYRADPRWNLPPAPSVRLPAITRPNGARNLKTTWEPYGDKWAPGFEPAVPEKSYTKGDIAEQLAQLNWDGTGKSKDDGTGLVLRNWQSGAGNKDDIFITWDKPTESWAAELEAIDVYFIKSLNKQQFDPKNVKANKATLEKYFNSQDPNWERVRVTAADLKGTCAVVDRIAVNGAAWYYYVKVVGVLKDGRFVDIRGAAVGTAKYRAEPRNELPPAPQHALELSRAKR